MTTQGPCMAAGTTDTRRIRSVDGTSAVDGSGAVTSGARPWAGVVLQLAGRPIG